MNEGAAELLLGVDLEVALDGRTLLSVPRIALRKGEILAVLGPNGSGKTTLLQVMAGLRRPTSGRLEYRDRSGEAAERELRRSSAVVFQRPHLWAGSVRANLELGLRLRSRGRRAGAARRAAVERIARQLGIAPLLDASARSLSGGEIQRVALARALAIEPEILFLDEPTANLDPEIRVSLREDLERVARSGAATILLATHDRTEAFFLADRVAVVREGRIIQTGTPSDLYEDPHDSFIARVTGAELALRGRVLERGDGFVEVRVGSIVLTARGDLPAGTEVKLAYRPEDLFLTRDSTTRGSARNRLTARIGEVRMVGGVLRVRLSSPVEMIAVVTRAAGDELGLREGEQIGVLCKATALHVFPL